MTPTYNFVKAESVCQWCGWTFEIMMSPFNASQMREWSTTVRIHKEDCRVSYVTTHRMNEKLIAIDYLTAAGEAFL